MNTLETLQLALNALKEATPYIEGELNNRLDLYAPYNMRHKYEPDEAAFQNNWAAIKAVEKEIEKFLMLSFQAMKTEERT